MDPFRMAQLRSTVAPSLLSSLLLAILLAALLVLLRILSPQGGLETQRPSDTSAGRPAVQPDAVPSTGGRRFVLTGDTINGAPLTDAVIVERIERIAARVPADLLAETSRAPHVRYVAHGFGAGDDAPIYYGVFREPAAALAFGCALDEALMNACEPASLMAGSAAYEDPPGVHCRPMRLALGAPAYEPDRCEAGS